jgi:hypothetical protein
MPHLFARRGEDGSNGPREARPFSTLNVLEQLHVVRAGVGGLACVVAMQLI